MKIESIRKIEEYIVETDGGCKYGDEYTTFRTDLNGENWEILMGSSWEEYYHDDEIKKLFKEFIKNG